MNENNHTAKASFYTAFLRVFAIAILISFGLWFFQAQTDSHLKNISAETKTKIAQAYKSGKKQVFLPEIIDGNWDEACLFASYSHPQLLLTQKNPAKQKNYQNLQGLEFGEIEQGLVFLKDDIPIAFARLPALTIDSKRMAGTEPVCRKKSRLPLVILSDPFTSKYAP